MSEQRRWTIYVCPERGCDYQAGPTPHQHFSCRERGHRLPIATVVVPASAHEAAERRAEQAEITRAFLRVNYRSAVAALDAIAASEQDSSARRLAREVRSALATPSEPVERACPDCGSVPGDLSSDHAETCKGTGRVSEPEQQAEERA